MGKNYLLTKTTIFIMALHWGEGVFQYYFNQQVRNVDLPKKQWIILALLKQTHVHPFNYSVNIQSMVNEALTGDYPL